MSLIGRFIKRFGTDVAIHANLVLPCDRHFTTILYGPSGCGKTTVMRCLAGLDKPSEGSIRMSGETWFCGESGVNRLPQKRRCGFVFQDYALFPHLNVEDNIGFGLSGSKAERTRRIEEILTRLELCGLAKRRIHQISAGQKQRVALGRSLVLKPRLMLFDEPFAALDTMLKRDLWQFTKEILTDARIPSVLVTHDPQEALLLGDEIVVMERGEVLQAGQIKEVFSAPIDNRVSRLIGIDTKYPNKALHPAAARVTPHA